ncbi:flagellar hook-associated protein FlgK [Thermosulfuriphilus ammonigenes]|uniref:Flagellar hook-associated protein 1 n=1 Tax=Thermosulfuriphilus ammonigenes TaxID=1936021 RepID=A0A6G7PYZ7_9BACT|nr:flagellar hook-associated protein FlgK [Thermosulfuriphilus ammonigenes]MBA2849783.1 flagellar hook-associated protein 1 FlgK [Thermosulfuriphilus ammonigenes]QIJ72668.1 flagellar hook-associated protein FlgK [Thermosulfuriphilus ammonigenes]
MAGIYSALNIAKGAIINAQTAVHVTGQNVANVNTEGYSRQEVVSAPYPPTPTAVGPIGNGVKVEQIRRYFDAFTNMNLNLRRSDLGLLEAQKGGMRLVESLFNETGDTGLARMMDDFFAAWQDVANRPEGISERRALIEKARVLSEAISEKYNQLIGLESDIGLKLQDVVKEINQIAAQIADLNRQITAIESENRQANDLRDQRDKLVARLSELAEIRYFETSQGAYAIILGKGYNLVDIDSYWQLNLDGNDVYWQGHSGEMARLTSEEVSKGELGGWLRIREMISDDWNYERLTSTKTVYDLDGSPLADDTRWVELGLSGTITFDFSGTDHDGQSVSATVSIDLAANPDSTVRDLLDEIEKAYNYQVTAYLDNGRLIIKDAQRGPGALSFSLDRSPTQVYFGRFDDEGLNHRLEELNLVGKFQIWARELIRAVNQAHSQGVGLEFYQGQLKGLYQTGGTGPLKSLPFYHDIKPDGSFFLWIKSQDMGLVPVKVNLSLLPTSTINDLASQINSSIDQALSRLGLSNTETVSASFVDGRLVFTAQDGYSFAFSNDASGILAATGINVFFDGWDAGSIEINQTLSKDPELIAAARLDRQAWRSEDQIFGRYVSRDSIDTDPASIKRFNASQTITVRFYDAEGNRVLIDTDSGQQIPELSVTVTTGETIAEVLEDLDNLEGLRAYINGNDEVVIALDPNVDKPYAYFELGHVDPPTNSSDDVLYFLRDIGLNAPQYLSSRGRKESDQYFSTPSGVSINEGADIELTFTFLDAQGEVLGYRTITVADGTDLATLATTIDNLSELRAGFTDGSSGRLYISLENPPEGTLSFAISVSGGDGDSNIDLSGGGVLTFSDVSDRQISSGLEHLVRPQQYIADISGYNSADLVFSGTLAIRFFDDQGREIGSPLSFSASSLSDVNTNGRVDLADLLAAMDASSALKAYEDNGQIVIALDSPPSDTAYFVIEGNANGSPWGEIALSEFGSGDSVWLKFSMGGLENWLFSEDGALDSDSDSNTVDPFRIDLSTDKGSIQIVQAYNDEANARYGLSSFVDEDGHLVVKTSGLYDTESFVVTDAWPRRAFTTTFSADQFDGDSYWFYLSEAQVSSSDTFAAQTLTISYRDSSNTETATETISVSAGDTLSTIVSALNALDHDGDGTADFSAEITSDNRLLIKINDPDQDNDRVDDFVRFQISTSITSTAGSLPVYLNRRRYIQDLGLAYQLQGFSAQPADNRNALALAATATETRANLDEANLSDYYDSLVGQVGIVSQGFNRDYEFTSDLVNQLQMIRDSVSGVSLDEEMANLVKFQHAFAAAAKIMTISDEMLDVLVNAKR